MSALRFHWRLPQSGEEADTTTTEAWERPETGIPDLEMMTTFCLAAESAGIDSLLVDFGFAKPDPILLSAALGQRTTRIKFIIAYRSGLICPTSFVQQLNTLSTFIDGRFSLNIVAGHSPDEQRGYGDFLPHDERYARTEEFLAVCHAYWARDGRVDFGGRYYRVDGGRLGTPFVSDGGRFPELFIAGSSEQARALAISQGSCWVMFAEAPGQLAPRVAEVRRAGRSAAVRCSVICRDTSEQALAAGEHLVSGLGTHRTTHGGQRTFVAKSDSVGIREHFREAESNDWLGPHLWARPLRVFGPAAAALVGSPDDVADALLEYKRIGVSQFILSGWPKLEQMVYFGEQVIPRVRDREASAG